MPRRPSILRLIGYGVAVAALLGTLGASAVASASPLVIIDPGHGGPYSNANANGVREKAINLAVALELRRQLLERGYRVSMTRTTDDAVTRSDLSTWNWSSSAWRWSYSADGHTGNWGGIPKDDLQARANIANAAGADVFVCIHCNGSANKSARGTETYASPRDALARSLAAKVQRELVSSTRLKDRGYHSTDFYVCRWTNAPAILVETAFISNPGDAALLRSRPFRSKVAFGIAKGLDTWFAGKPFTASSRPVRTRSAAEAAAASSRRQFPNGSSKVVLARADRWRDVAGAPALAARLGAPLLWVDAGAVPAATRSELARLHPGRLITVGVSGSFGASVKADGGGSVPLSSACASAAALPLSAVDEISAPSRSELSVAIAEKTGPSSTGELIVTDASDSYNLLAAAPVAAARRIPLLLAENGRVAARAYDSSATSPAKAKSVLLVGSADALPSPSGSAGVKRYAGYFSERSAVLSGRYYPMNGTRTYSVVVADQRYGAEYLSAAAYAARERRPLLPVSGGIFSAYTRLWISNRREPITGFEVFDARSSVPWSVEHALRKADHL